MGILNVTPDSFYDGGSYMNVKSCLKCVNKMLKDGVDIVDIGGYSSRPGAEHIEKAEERDRVLPVIEAIGKEYPDLLISIDTFRSGVAKEAVKAGADIVNDISGGEMDDDMFNTVAALKVPYILMHMRGTPQDMQSNTSYENLMNDLLEYFSPKLKDLRSLGVHDIIVDPGFGFGKSLNGNYELLHKLNAFKILEVPVLVGLSRKSMIGKLLGDSEEQTLKGTTAMNLVALLGGASIIRVHDVREGREMVKLYQRLVAIV